MIIILLGAITAASGCASTGHVEQAPKPALPALYVAKGGEDIFNISDEFYGRAGLPRALGFYCLLRANPELRGYRVIGPEHEIIVPVLPDQKSTLIHGDFVTILVEPVGDLSYGDEYKVSSDGCIDLPVLGRLHVAGLTPAKAETRIEQAYRDRNMTERSDLQFTKVEQSGTSTSIPPAWHNRRTSSPSHTEYTRLRLLKTETWEIDFRKYRLNDVLTYCAYSLTGARSWRTEEDTSFIIDPAFQDDTTCPTMPAPEVLYGNPMCGRILNIFEVLKILADIHHLTIEIEGSKAFLKPIRSGKPAASKDLEH